MVSGISIGLEGAGMRYWYVFGKSGRLHLRQSKRGYLRYPKCRVKYQAMHSLLS